MALAFLSTRVATPEGIRAAAVVVEDGRIVSVRDSEDIPPSVIVRDFGDHVLLPGFVDTHVHVNEPGRTEWEGFETATRAAAAGGVTLLVDMPLNCLPETTTVPALEAKRAAAARKCYIDWAAWGGLTDENVDNILPLANAGVLGFKCFLIDPGIEGLKMIGEAALERAAPALARCGLPLLVHAEKAEPIEAATREAADRDWREYRTYLQSRPDASELEAIRMLIRVCRTYRLRLHIVHLSTAQALRELDAARTEGLPITVETCPHYLHFAAEEIPDSATLLKCAPPIRSQENREALWKGLRDGSIDLVASDHSPCVPAMKAVGQGNFQKAWGGIAGLSLGAAVLWTGMRSRGIPLGKLAEWMASAPAKLAGVSDRKGAIAPGRDADFVVFDPEAEFEVKPERLHYRHAVSPYMRQRFYGAVKATFLRGGEIYSEGRFPEPPRGREALEAQAV